MGIWMVSSYVLMDVRNIQTKGPKARNDAKISTTWVVKRESLLSSFRRSLFCFIRLPPSLTRRI